MAAYVVPSGHTGAHAKTLVGGVVDTVTFTGADLTAVEILSNGAADIYVTFGAGSTPTVAGTNCWRIPPYAGATVIEPHTSGDTVVKLLSAGAPVYSVSKV